jgi:hypothetical protein
VHYDSCPLGHAKLNTTALYTRVATSTTVWRPVKSIGFWDTARGATSPECWSGTTLPSSAQIELAAPGIAIAAIFLHV